jgi:hypothetical protein
VQPGLAHVDMRIGLVADRRICACSTIAGVTMACRSSVRDRQVRPDDGAQPRRTRPRHPRRRWGPSSRAGQKDAVQRGPCALCRVADEAGDMVEGLARDRRAGVAWAETCASPPAASRPHPGSRRVRRIHVAKAVDGGLARGPAPRRGNPASVVSPFLKVLLSWTNSAGQNVEGHGYGPFRAGGSRQRDGRHRPTSAGLSRGSGRRRAGSGRQRRSRRQGEGAGNLALSGAIRLAAAPGRGQSATPSGRWV